jgi:hypothetical protein
MRLPTSVVTLLATAAIAGDVSPSPEAAVSALWRALSNDPGAAADTTTLSRLFHRDAVIFGARRNDGKPELRVTPAAKFIESQATRSEKGFYECEIARSVKRYGRLAAVYSVVESRSRRDQGSPDFTGVNSLQLYQSDNGWKIVSLYYHLEEDEVPVPRDGGVSGRCL